ncbi:MULTISPECIES: hypothetical protein [unclassified Ensifer]|uniref:hypothetical protein n=1 Tax=unclassified Ensifer TaxID=2633371 RepID=UPI000813082B|nr:MULTISPECIES: hypothetical protein [unclassified Ensifer]OCO98689.1 hypothetical protein BC362_28410 [Ensifer sp. LC14]OCP13168.1 hypothetical protein BC374_13025 [Ensifer sp. LC13]OCP28149.1 hypothetical protein BC364_11425 [Ensifer sp. LC499]
MLIPIQTARTTAASADDASAKVQQPAAQLPASQRGEAIQKILDALTRHLSGREILSKDALVRLMEDLARILKFPPLPQEGGREFVRRLVAFLESMPTSDRLLLERQLGGRSLAMRVGLLAELPAIRNGTSTPRGTATPMPAQARDVILRNPSLQPALPFNPTATRAPIAGEVALLQAVLRKTFGVGNDSDVIQPQGDDSEQVGTRDAPSKGRSEKPTERSATRASNAPTTSPDGAPIESAAALLGGEGEVQDVTSLTAPVAEADETPQNIDTGHGETEAAIEDGAAAPLKDQATGEMEATDTADDPDPDGTYGPLPDADEGDGRKAAPVLDRGDQEARSMRVLSEAIKTLIRDSVALPGGATDAEPGSTAQQTDEAGTPPQVPAKDAATAARGADAAVRQRQTPDGSNVLPSLLDDRSDEANAARRASADMRSQRPADEQTMQQVIARLVENGLPREAIPFTMIPYPPAANGAADTEDLGHEMPGGSGEDTSGEEEGAEEGDSDGEGGGEPTDEVVAADEMLDAPDAYDLYRKLGGLG